MDIIKQENRFIIAKNQECKHYNFVENYSYNAYKPEIRKQVLSMIVNGTGTRATGRILGISKDTVTALLKKLKNGYGMLIMIILKTVKI
ncbi:MAG: hypothetical protein LBJ32_00465, partial [Oscillospiraceae bacterium]|nr:hypothetical protein [Oscillospiraceae bacterium]